jgi:peptidoglycan/xylan/chitin deacetylase (PgdA/CDA1 family)
MPVVCEVGVYQPSSAKTSGWTRVLEQEKTPYRKINEPGCPVMVCEGQVPDRLAEFLQEGGVAIITAARELTLPFPVRYRGQAVTQLLQFPELNLPDVRIAGISAVFAGAGFGKITLHENRVEKGGIRTGHFPAFIQQRVGRGYCLFTGLPLSELLLSVGDTLRTFSRHSSITERIVTIDKAQILRILVWILRKAFSLLGLPYVHLCYYPNQAASVFAFRIDVDGTYGENVTSIAQTARAAELPITFFINQSLCLGEQNYLHQIDPANEIGNHGNIHNLFDTKEDNLRNVSEGRAWLQENSLPVGPWYAAPRGMWNPELGAALEELGYLYSSDFGLEIDGLPFFPRVYTQRTGVIQIPIHPFSVERAVRYAEENGLNPPSEEEVLSYFTAVARDHLEQEWPIFFYGHPEHFGKMAKTILFALKRLADDWNVPNTTLSKYAEWWKRRDALEIYATHDDDQNELVINCTLPEDISVRVFASDDLRLSGVRRNNVVQVRTLQMEAT